MKDLTQDSDAIEWLGVKYKTILTTEQSGGAMSIVDSWSPVGSGPPRHIHAGEDETFVVITGTCKVWIAGEERLAGPGESVFIPRGIDNSPGDLIFLPDDKRFGPLAGHIIGTSFGYCSHYLVLREEIGGKVQGGADNGSSVNRGGLILPLVLIRMNQLDGNRKDFSISGDDEKN